MTRARKSALIALFLALATLTVYGQVRNHGFLTYDDPVYVTENLHVRSGWSAEGVRWAFTSRALFHWHPVTWLSHMTDAAVFGLRPGAHHLVSLGIHLLSVLLLFAALNRATGSVYRSAFAAALFALHPLNVEPVVWISARKDVLSTLFWMIALWAYVRYAERPGVSRFALVLAAFVLGLMAKPMVLTLPLILLLMDLWPLARRRLPAEAGGSRPPDGVPGGHSFHRATLRRLIAEKAVLLIPAGLSLILTLSVMQGSGPGLDLSGLHVTLESLSRALVTAVTYLGLMMVPRDLAVYYPPLGSTPLWQAWLAFSLLLLITLTVLRLARRAPYLAVGWFWYGITILPVLTLLDSVGPQVMACRFTYIPLIGPFMAVSWGAAGLLSRFRHARPISASAAGVVLLALALCSWRQAGYWRDTVPLFEHTLRVTTDNVRALTHLGDTLSDQGKLDEAEPLLREALRLRPDNPEAHNNLGVVLARQGRSSEAIAHFRMALQKPDTRALNNLGVALARQGRLQEAMALFTRALKNDPGFADAHNNLGTALSFQGRYRDAALHFQEALRLRPWFEEARRNLDKVSRRRDARPPAPPSP